MKLFNVLKAHTHIHALVNMFSEERQKEFLGYYTKAHDRLGRYVRSMVWAREDARDIISETILIACENFEKLRNKEAFVYYLFGIASRLIKKRSSTKDRYQTLDDEGWDKLSQFSSTGHSDDCEDLYRMLNGLPVKYRESLVLFEIAGFSINEITELQGGTISGVKSRLVRARKMLTEIYEKEKAVLK